MNMDVIQATAGVRQQRKIPGRGRRLRAWALCGLAALFAIVGWPDLVSAGTNDQLLVLCYHDIPTASSNDPYAVDVTTFVEQLEYMKSHGCTFVGPAQVLEASAGAKALPHRAVMLTFDDAYVSFTSNVVPVLKMYKAPALLAVCAGWTEHGAPADISAPIMSWDQIRQLSQNPLVTIASHSYDLHKAVRSNPQGNTAHAAVTRIFMEKENRYETAAEYKERIAVDHAKGVQMIADKTGKKPEIMVWPYGESNEMATEECRRAGFKLAFLLNNTVADLSHPMRIDRWIEMNNPDMADFIEDFERYWVPGAQDTPFTRSIQVDLDQICDKSPEQTEKNLGRLLDRVVALEPTAVFLQACTDTDGDGAADKAYFPNRGMPVRMDLLSRVASQLFIRGYRVYINMPILDAKPADAGLAGQIGHESRPAVAGASPGRSYRLSSSAPATKDFVGALYEDLAINVRFHGVAIMEEVDPGDSGLDALASTAVSAVRKHRPEAVSMRRVGAKSILEKDQAAALSVTLKLHDFAVVRISPSEDGGLFKTRMLEQLVKRAGEKPGATGRILFMLDATVDAEKQVPEPELLEWTRTLAAAGARHIGYYPDDFLRDRPAIKAMRTEYSTKVYLFNKPARRNVAPQK
ncbi:MAG: poly-beta-1,6-N-acetyl-D-glucosamine N-deacetylase PgaB [Verrucomicrobia bacterium]|nr:poly-beta-1,6-N-acetyl-D-glucosamine N-deacetylase PgaB [Verrucomicrobiota bacterium]